MAVVWYVRNSWILRREDEGEDSGGGFEFYEVARPVIGRLPCGRGTDTG